MRIVLFGYQTWGHDLLTKLLASRHEVVLLVTHPDGDDPYEGIWNDHVGELAREHGIPVVEREIPNDDELAARIREADADVAVAINWRRWIAPEIFSIPRLGTLNTHDALLPKYAGFAPLNWALVNGEPEVGITAHLMSAGLDQGDVVGQASVEVGPTDTTADLFHKTLALFGPLTLESLEKMESGDYTPIPQDLSQASFFHKRTDEENRIDWSWPAEELERLVRAQTDPYPNAFTHRGTERIGILEASVSRQVYGGTGGRIFYREGDGVAIVAGPQPHKGLNRGLVIQRLRTPDGTVMTGAEYFTRMGGYLTPYPVG
ncbi:unannotated protein [freshwater metagenome]|uniref:Unannotated protein n=1 Tax=freshwater metagenome TaxID=449393 RepID=A0A6J7FEA8_9ZZZZ|nr:methionyl-tRNA formyltransferase [Actinomycetota bacterium]